MKVDVPIVNSTIILCDDLLGTFGCTNVIVNTQKAKNIFINCTNNNSCANMAIHAEYAHKLRFFAWKTNSGTNTFGCACVCVFACVYLVFVCLFCALSKNTKIRKYKIKKKNKH